MPAKGRPPKYHSKEERDAARRTQTRLNVRAFRHRKHEKERSSQQMQSRTVVVVGQAKPCRKAPAKPLVPYQVAVVSRSLDDIADVSDRARIDLYFDVMPAIVRGLELATAMYPWSLAFTQLQTEDGILGQAIFAWGSRLMSILHNIKKLGALSREAYHDTLVKLQHRMSSFRRKDALLLCTVMAAVANFEIGEGSSRGPGSPWAIHSAGIIQLIKAAGPEAFQTPLGLQTLRGQRYAAVTLAIWDPKSNFLNKKEWATIPFLIQGKTKEDHLWDIFFLVPEILGRAKTLAAAVSTKQELEKIVETSQALSDILASTSSAVVDSYASYAAANRMWSTPPASWFKTEYPPALSHSWQFDNLTTAEAFVGLWSISVQLHLVGLSARGTLQSAGHEKLAQLFSSLLEDGAEEAALNICRSMEFCLGKDPSDLRGAIVMGNFPFYLAVQYINTYADRYQKEREWCKDVGGKITQRCLSSGRAMSFGTTSLLS